MFVGQYFIKDFRQVFKDDKVNYSSKPISFVYFNYNMIIERDLVYGAVTYNFFLSLASRGHLFWVDQKGNVVHYYQNIKEYISLQNLDLLLSNLCKKSVKTFKNHSELIRWISKQKKPKFANGMFSFLENASLIALDTLPMVLGEKFDVNEKQFIKVNNEFYLNKFYPANNLVDSTKFITTIDSIFPIYNYKYGYKDEISQLRYYPIMQYLYHISAYKIEVFNYIISWLSNMIKYITNNPVDDCLFHSVLVLRGGEKSGKEIFFNQIIKPLFGNEYCLKIDNEVLSQKNLDKEKYNKIFYNFDNISTVYLEDRKKRELIQNILTKQDKNIIGTVITTDKKHIPYDLSAIEYVVLELPDDIDTMYIPDDFKNKFKSLNNTLNTDVHNFSRILKCYTSRMEISYIKDIDITKKQTLEDSIIDFADQLIGNRYILQEIKNIIISSNIVNVNDLDNTLKSIEKLYNKHKKIERKYIYELFKYKYDHDISPTTLYKKLTELDHNFFETVLAPGGAKCFYFPNSN